MRCVSIGSLHDPVVWYGINYAGTQVTQWDFQNKRKVGLDWYEFLCFGSPTVKLASQHNYLIPYHVTRSCKGPFLAVFAVGFCHLGF